MRNISFLLTLTISVFLLSSCENYKKKYEEMMNEHAAMQQQLNAMSEEDRLIRGEYSEAIETLNSIEDTLRAINEREKDIQELTTSKEFSGNLSQRQAVLAKLQALKDANEKSKEQARQMQNRLNAARIENEQLRKMIAQAEGKILAKERELVQAQGAIDGLRRALNKMEAQLLEKQGELASTYEDLKNERDELSRTNEKLNRTIADLKNKTTFIQEQAKGYIACGSKKVLRQKNILSKSSNKLTKEYQDAVKANSSVVNYFERDIIECGGDGNIDLVLPERDNSSYDIEGSKLYIRNKELFWATDKIVVIVKD